jgi:hypothetical protein
MDQTLTVTRGSAVNWVPAAVSSGETLAVLDHTVYDQLDHFINVPERFLAGVSHVEAPRSSKAGQYACQRSSSGSTTTVKV